MFYKQKMQQNSFLKGGLRGHLFARVYGSLGIKLSLKIVFTK